MIIIFKKNDYYQGIELLIHKDFFKESFMIFNPETILKEDKKEHPYFLYKEREYYFQARLTGCGFVVDFFRIAKEIVETNDRQLNILILPIRLDPQLISLKHNLNRKF